MTAMLQQRSPEGEQSEGRWPRICELSGRPGETRVAMVSMHTSPLAQLGKSRDAGGMNVYVRELARALGRLGISVDCFTRWTDPSLPQILPLGSRARLIHIPAGPISPLHKDELYAHLPQFVAGIECFAVTERTDYHLIHSHYWLSGVAGDDLAQRWGAPHLTMFHTLARLKQHARPEEVETALRIDQERRVIASADRMIVATEDERSQITRLYGAARSRLRIVPCGVDLAKFTPENRAEARATLSDRLGLTDVPIILFVGRLDPLKGADLLLDALARMQTPAQLVLVGGDEADPERARLRDLTYSLGIADRVRLVDAAPQEELPAYYRAADLLAVASHYESFGLVAVEALACGTPVIAPRVGGLPAIVHDGENGALLDFRSPLLYAERLDALLADTEALHQMHQNARQSVLRFRWSNVARDIAAEYADMLHEADMPLAVCD